MQPSIARANKQLDSRQQLANTPPPQSTKWGLHSVSIHQMAPPKRTSDCSLLLNVSTPKGWKAELASVVSYYWWNNESTIRDGSHLRRTFWGAECALAQIFTALHGMQTRSSDKNSVCPSVCHTRVLWQNGRKIGPDLYTIRKNI